MILNVGNQMSGSNEYGELYDRWDGLTGSRSVNKVPTCGRGVNIRFLADHELAYGLIYPPDII